MPETGQKAARWLVAATLASATAVLSPGIAEPANASVATFTQPGRIDVGDAVSDPFPSALGVSGLNAQVVDIDLTLTGVTHGWPADLDVVLVAPNGRWATVMSDLGGGNQTPASGGTLIFDDDASASVPLGLPSGRYVPGDEDLDPDDPDLDLEGVEGTFADLAASAWPNGRWELYVNDDTVDFDGSIASWSLTFQVSDPPVITSPANGSRIAGTTLPVRGTGTPGNTFYLRLDQLPVRQVTVAPDGSWATDYTGVADGSHTVRASTTLGGETTASTTTVHLDSTAPTGTLLLRTVRGGPELTSSRRVYLKIERSELLRGIRVSNDGAPLGPLLPGTGEVPWLLGDHDGTRRVFVQLEDLAGNSHGYITDTVTLDRVGPRVLRTTPAAGAVKVRRDKVVAAHFNDFVTPSFGSLSSPASIYRAGADRRVRATVRYDASTATVRILPRDLLRRDTRYKVVVGGFHDEAGNYVDQDPAKASSQPMVWRFRTR